MANVGVQSAATGREARDPLAAPGVTAAATFIRGTTLLYPVLGSPIAQVKAPMLYNALFARTGLDAAVDAALAADH